MTPSDGRAAVSLTVADLLATPSAVDTCPRDQVPVLLAAVASEQARLAGLQVTLYARLLASSQATNTPDSLLTIPDVAGRLHVPVAFAYDLARRRILPTVRVGKYVRVRESSLAKWMQQREEPLERDVERTYTPRKRRAAVATPTAAARVVPLRGREARG